MAVYYRYGDAVRVCWRHASHPNYEFGKNEANAAS